MYVFLLLRFEEYSIQTFDPIFFSFVLTCTESSLRKRSAWLSPGRKFPFSGCVVSLAQVFLFLPMSLSFIGPYLVVRDF